MILKVVSFHRRCKTYVNLPHTKVHISFRWRLSPSFYLLSKVTFYAELSIREILSQVLLWRTAPWPSNLSRYLLYWTSSLIDASKKLGLVCSKNQGILSRSCTQWTRDLSGDSFCAKSAGQCWTTRRKGIACNPRTDRGNIHLLQRL